MPLQRQVRSLRALVTNVGLTCVDIHRTGTSHLAVRVKAANAVEQDFYFASTPSDHRAELNNRALLRRFARQHTTLH